MSARASPDHTETEKREIGDTLRFECIALLDEQGRSIYRDYPY